MLHGNFASRDKEELATAKGEYEYGRGTTMVKVVAKNYAKEDKLNEIIELYKELVELTRQEEGCLKYELCQDKDDPAILTMIEEWTTGEALENHFNKEHFKRIVPQIKQYMKKETDLNIYHKLI